MADPPRSAGPQLDFLGWDRPVLHSAALRLLGRAIDGREAGPASRPGPVDLSRTLVVLPGGRAGRRLKEILLGLAESHGRALRPPEVATVGGFPERLYRPPLPRPDSVLDRQAWTRAIAQVGDREIARLVGGGDDLGGAESAARGRAAAALADAALVRLIRELQHEVGGAGLDFGAVAEMCRSGLLFNDEGRWRALHDVATRYRSLLRGLGFEDVSSARAAALSGRTVGTDKEVWIVGCPDLPPIARAFVTALAEAATVRVLVAAPEALAHRFDGFGCVIPEAWADVHVELSEADVHVVASPATQADAVLRQLFEIGGRLPAEEITVGVPDPEVVPYIVERLEERGVRVRDARGRAIRATSPFRLLEAVARYLERPDFESLANLARHPVFEESVSRATATDHTPASHTPASRIDLPALLDRYQTVHLQAGLDPRNLPSGGERTSAPVSGAMRDVLKGVADLLAPVGAPEGPLDSRGGRGKNSRAHGRAESQAASRSLAAWAPHLAELLDGLFGGAHPEDPGARELSFVLERIAESLSRFVTLPASVDPPVPAHRAIRALLEDIQDEPLPEEWEGPAVDLLGWLELALDDAAEMIVTGFNDPFVPSSVTSHPFLPHSLREKIGLLGNRGRWARDLHALETMLRTRGRIHLVTGRRSGAGDPLMPSRLLFAADAGVVAARLARILALDAYEPMPAEGDGLETGGSGDGPGDGSGDGAGDGTGSTFARLPPEPVLTAPSAPDRIQVTAFRDLLTDPYRYALSRMLGLEPLDDEAREMDAAVFGTLAHVVLHRFGRSPACESADADEIYEALDVFLIEEARSRFGTRPLPAVQPQVGQLRTRLAAFAKWQAGWVRKGWRIRGAEVSPASGGAPFDVDGTPILLRGTIDRVDENMTTGEWCVLDYKTADQAKEPDKVHRVGPPSRRRWVDLQLPLYRILAAHIERDRGGGPMVPESARARLLLGYVRLPSTPGRVGEAMAAWTDAELAEAEEEARRVVRRLREGRFVYDPAVSSIRSGDPLAVVVGEGVLRLSPQ